MTIRPPAAWLLVVPLLLGSLLAAGLGGDGAAMTVLFPPWWSGARAVTAVAGADGAVMALGRWPAIVLASSARPGFAARLHAAGAWFAVSTGAAGCGSESGGRRS